MSRFREVCLVFYWSISIGDIIYKIIRTVSSYSVSSSNRYVFGLIFRTTLIWTDILVSVSFLEYISLVITTFLSTIGIATIFISKIVISSWLHSIVNFVKSFKVFSFILLVFSISYSSQVCKNIEKLSSFPVFIFINYILLDFTINKDCSINIS